MDWARAAGMSRLSALAGERHHASNSRGPSNAHVVLQHDVRGSGADGPQFGLAHVVGEQGLVGADLAQPLAHPDRNRGATFG